MAKEIETKKERQYYIFQGNPDLWGGDKFDDLVLDMDEDEWYMSRFISNINVGDSILLYKCGDDAKILAECTAASLPFLKEEIKDDLYSDEKSRRGRYIKIKKVMNFNNPVSRNWLKENIPDLSILKSSQGSNFEITEQQYKKITNPIKNEQNRDKSGILASYYLSRFNDLAYKHLDLGNQGETHDAIGNILGINTNTIKNWRDEFDPHFWDYGNDRVGWNERETRQSLNNIMTKYSSLDEGEVFDIVYALMNKDKDPKTRIFSKEENADIPLEDKNYIEGQLKEVKMLSRKRNQVVVKTCKNRDNYTCLSCSFKYKDKIVEAHHLHPHADAGEGEISSDDLVTLCPTCHRIAHEIIREEDKKDVNKRKKYKKKLVIIAAIKEIL